MSAWPVDEWDVIHMPFFGGWVVRRRATIKDGRYTIFPETTYDVLDSETVKPHRTQARAEAKMARLLAKHRAAGHSPTVAGGPWT